jgi:hypothetical protein
MPIGRSRRRASPTDHGPARLGPQLRGNTPHAVARAGRAEPAAPAPAARRGLPTSPGPWPMPSPSSSLWLHRLAATGQTNTGRARIDVGQPATAGRARWLVVTLSLFAVPCCTAVLRSADTLQLLVVLGIFTLCAWASHKRCTPSSRDSRSGPF